jgi:hypothetical protein
MSRWSRLAFALLALGLGACAAKPGATADGGSMDTGSAPVCPMNADDIISTFNTDNGIDPVSGRSGGWYVYPDKIGDPNGTFDPPLPMGMDPYPIDMTIGNPYCTGPGSFHVKATNFRAFGAALGTDFVAPVAPMVKGAYDASQYKGIAFWAKAAANIQHVQIKFPDIYTDPQVPEPMCILTSGSTMNCSPYIVKIGAEADNAKYAGTKIDTTWRRLEIFFADAVQDQYNTGFHRDPPNDKLDVQHLLGMAIQVNADFSVTPAAANDFEIWVDDVEFIR